MMPATLVELELEPVDEEGRWLFYRVELRRSRFKRPCDCGCWIDATEPYRYQVGRIAGAERLWQQLDCEFCSRGDNAY